jgi:hypothetical protein
MRVRDDVDNTLAVISPKSYRYMSFFSGCLLETYHKNPTLPLLLRFSLKTYKAKLIEDSYYK